MLARWCNAMSALGMGAAGTRGLRRPRHGLWARCGSLLWPFRNQTLSGFTRSGCPGSAMHGLQSVAANEVERQLPEMV